MFDIPSTLKDLDIPIEFKNFKEVAQCFNLLDKNDKPFAGNTKKAAVAELQRYCNFDKTNNGNKWLITEVYNEPKPQVRKQRKDAIYAKLSAILILCDLYLNNYHYLGEAEYTKREISCVLGIFNENWQKVFCNGNLPYLDALPEGAKRYSRNFMFLCLNKQNDIIRSALNCLKSHYQIFYDDITMGLERPDKFTKRFRELTTIEKKQLMAIENKVMHEFGYTNKQQIIFSKDITRDYDAFRKEVDEQFYDYTKTIKHTWHKIRIHYNYDNLILGIKDLCNEILDELNNWEQYQWVINKKTESINELNMRFKDSIINKAETTYKKKLKQHRLDRSVHALPEEYVFAIKVLSEWCISHDAKDIEKEYYNMLKILQEDQELGLYAEDEEYTLTY